MLQDWFGQANAAMARLDRVKPSVYNMGLYDPKDLKAGSGSSRYRSVTGVPTMPTSTTSRDGTPIYATPPLATISYQKAAWYE
jgi:hypothetical protein